MFATSPELCKKLYKKLETFKKAHSLRAVLSIVIQRVIFENVQINVTNKSVYLSKFFGRVFLNLTMLKYVYVDLHFIFPILPWLELVYSVSCNLSFPQILTSKKTPHHCHLNDRLLNLNDCVKLSFIIIIIIPYTTCDAWCVKFVETYITPRGIGDRYNDRSKIIV